MLHKIIIASLIVGILAAIIYIPKAIRVYNVVHLFDEDKIVDNFINMNKIFPSTPVHKANNPHIFQKKSFNLPEYYEMDGQEYNLAEALEYFKTDGLIVLHGGVLAYENYWQGNSKDQPHISWSVAKSFLSALIGIACF